jgi:hypothetical protein
MNAIQSERWKVLAAGFDPEITGNYGVRVKCQSKIECLAFRRLCKRPLLGESRPLNLVLETGTKLTRLG